MRYKIFNPKAWVVTMLMAIALIMASSTVAAGHSVTDLTFNPGTPNFLVHGNRVTINFSYRTNQAGGVRIFMRPFTGSAPTPGYGASGAPISPPSASGTGTQWFTINTGAVTVNRVRIQMWNSNQTLLLFQAFVPVHYEFRAP